MTQGMSHIPNLESLVVEIVKDQVGWEAMKVLDH
jgi:hypothetical protein